MQLVLPDLQIDHAMIEDVYEVSDLLYLCDLAVYGESDQTSEDVRSEWQTLPFNVTTDAWVARTHEDQLIGYAEVRKSRAAVYQILLRVLPEYAHSNVGASLLQRAEARAYQYVSQERLGTSMLTSSASSTDEATQQLLEQAGYKHVNSFWRMETILRAPPPQPLWPDGITHRSFILGLDEAATFATMNEAFQDDWRQLFGTFQAWKETMMEQEDFDPSLWILAFDGGTQVGAVICRSLPIGKGWVDTLGVRSSWRRRGLGMALLLAVFGELYRRDIRHIFLGVDAQNPTGATRLYERAGMDVTRKDLLYEKSLPISYRFSSEAVEAHTTTMKGR
jgi:mycothiol synthase